jgi:hypothetical protein
LLAVIALFIPDLWRFLGRSAKRDLAQGTK